MKKTKEKYPRIKELGLEIINQPIPHVEDAALIKTLKEKGIEKQFDEYFGVQMRISEGCYAHDIEAVLERIFSGKLTGTQLFSD